ncbi:MAG: PAS domain S-box protein [Chloroflexi bacterium]|nr:PAS domain S-box protein [Chloroflexota bacterium]
MIISAVIYYVLILFSLGVVLMLAFYMQRLWHLPGTKLFLLTILALALTQGTFAVLSISQTPESAFLWARLRFLGISLSPVLLLLFILAYTGRTLAYPRLVIPAMLIIPFLTQVILWSDRVVPWFFAEWSVGKFSFLTVELSRFGPWFQVHVAQSYILFGIALYLLISAVVNARFGQHLPMLWIALGTLVVLAPSSLPTLLGNSLPLNPTPLGISAGMIIYAWGIFRHRLFDLVTEAQNTVFASFQDAVIVLSDKNEVIQWNLAARQLLENGDPLLHQPLSEVLARHGLSDPLPLERETPFEICLSSRHFDVRISPLRLSNGRSVGKALVLRDITEPKRTAEELQKSEEMYRLLAENSSDLILLNALDTSFLYASPSCISMSGYTPAELMAMSIEEIAGLTYQPDRQASEALYLHAIVEGKGTHSAEIRLMRKDGSHYWSEVQVTPICDRNGETEHVLTVARDISQRKYIEEALIESNRRYDQLVQNLPAMVYLLRRSPDGRYSFDYVSPTARKYVGLEPEAIMEDTSALYSQIHPEDLPLTCAGHDESARSLAPLQWEGRTIINSQISWARLRVYALATR